jgi:hypothetical protein
MTPPGHRPGPGQAASSAERDRASAAKSHGPGARGAITVTEAAGRHQARDDKIAALQRLVDEVEESGASPNGMGDILARRVSRRPDLGDER